MRNNYILDNRKVKKFFLTIIMLLVILFLAYKSIFYLSPFIVAFALSSLIEPLVRILVSKAKLPRSLAAAISLILVLIVLGFLATIVITKVIVEVKGIADNSPFFINEVYRNILRLSTKGNDLYISLPIEVTAHIGGLIGSALKSISNLINPILRGVVFTATSLPSALIFFLITILSTFFMISGRRDIANGLKSRIPEFWYSEIITIKNEVFSSLFKLVKAYLIIMSITFTELLIGFTIIKLRYAIILALLICLIDILPVLGSGTILIPWSIYSLITGNTKLAISLVVLYAIILIIRQMIEPKIIGNQIGVHPLATLMSIYIGLKLFGAPGLMLGPIIMLILKNIVSSIFRDKTILDLLFTEVETNSK